MSFLPLILAEATYPRSSSRYSRDLLLESLKQLQEVQRELQARAGAGLDVGDDGFKVNLDVQQFRPDEVSVKVVDKTIVVEAKHEERQDEHGYISRSFVRRYLVPDDVDIDQVASTLSSDGVLSIAAPKKKPVALPGPNERVVPIVRTTASAVKQATEAAQKEAVAAAAASTPAEENRAK